MKFDKAYEFYNTTFFRNKLPGAFITLQSKSGSFGYFAKGRFRAIEKDVNLDEIALNPDYFFYGETEIMQTLVHEMCHQWQYYHGKPSRSGYHNKEWADQMQSIGLMPSSTGYEGGKQTGQKIADYVIQEGLFDLATKDLIEKDKIIDWKYFSWESYQLQAVVKVTEDSIHFNSTDGIEPGAYITVGQSTAVADNVDHETNIVDYHIIAGPETIKQDAEAFIKIPAAKKRKNKIKYTCPECELNVWGKPDIKVLCFECNLLLKQY